MSHSQFHCIKSFILRHAWLNLWDKHMTTGRINQVTIVRYCISNNHPCQKGTRNHRKHNKPTLQMNAGALIELGSAPQKVFQLSKRLWLHPSSEVLSYSDTPRHHDRRAWARIRCRYGFSLLRFTSDPRVQNQTTNSSSWQTNQSMRETLG